MKAELKATNRMEASETDLTNEVLTSRKSMYQNGKVSDQVKGGNITASEENEIVSGLESVTVDR